MPHCEGKSEQYALHDATDLTAKIAGGHKTATQLLHRTTSLFYTPQQYDVCPYLTDNLAMHAAL